MQEAWSLVSPAVLTPGTYLPWRSYWPLSLNPQSSRPHLTSLPFPNQQPMPLSAPLIKIFKVTMMMFMSISFYENNHPPVWCPFE